MVLLLSIGRLRAVGRRGCRLLVRVLVYWTVWQTEPPLGLLFGHHQTEVIGQNALQLQSRGNQRLLIARAGASSPTGPRCSRISRPSYTANLFD